MRNWIVVALILLVVGLIGAFGTFRKDGALSFGTEKVAQEQTVAGDGIEEVEIHTGSLDLTVVPSSSNEVKAELTGRASKKYRDKLKLQLEKEGNVLRVSVEDGVGFAIGINIRNLDLRLELPEQQYRKLMLDAGSGDIDIAQLNADHIDLHSGSGDMTLKKLNSQSIEAEISSGNMSFADVTAADLIAVDAGSGNVSTEGVKAKKITVDVGSGDVELEDAVAELQIETNSGDIDLILKALEQPAELETGSGDVSILTDEQPASARITFSHGSGDLDNEWDGGEQSTDKDDRDVLLFGSGSIPLHIHTGSGDLTVGAK
ncbi:DUF4097 family beta strand repeat-containing protein [Paenibacillus lignilyticus]|uniref:DUF4097 family beta strand repeat protein n=1 Tax=Paenibacillus lignilyticus TaxID=1172615 RepID=A0ABS5CKF1_9BACL|nr:DUF4097 family beta strand repeat-containing protein [Paenibacillus lignilyticus]MBP3966359.1 DUF4097 family beta strand repeat protein [Paenibacillus lignilyticus]